MPRNNRVYGKRPKATLSFTTTTFSWSTSPSKAPLVKERSGEGIHLAEELKKLSLREGSNPKRTEGAAKPCRNSSRAEDGTRPQRRALGTKDGNATPKPQNKRNEEAAVSEETSEAENVEPREDNLRTKGSTPSFDVKKTAREPLITYSAKSSPCPLSIKDRNVDSRAVPPQAASKRLPRMATYAQKPGHPGYLPGPSPTSNDGFPPHLVDYSRPLLHFCDSANITSFSTWADSLSTYFNILKIAEASYGEVYRLSLKAPRPGLSKSDESVLKIIALKPPPDFRRAAGQTKKEQKAEEEKIAMMSSVGSVVSEVQLLQRMTSIPGFTNFRDLRVLVGRPSGPFVEAWREFNKARPKVDKSIFPDPSKKSSYGEEQLWAAIEMQDAGTDLEHLTLAEKGGIWALWDVFWGVVLAIGKGEEGAQFEHRDLHLGNICIRNAAAGGASIPSIRNTNRNFGFTGLETTIIDYTLSRADMGDLVKLPDGTQEERVAYLDLNEDEALFQGDADVDYQYEIYRYMRSYVYLDDPLANLNAHWDEAMRTGRTWKGYHPQTNLIWLHFVLHTLLEQLETGCGHKGAWLAEGENTTLAARKARMLRQRLKKLRALLKPNALKKSGMRSVRDLVAMALEERWLDERDVIGICGETKEGHTGSATKAKRKARPRVKEGGPNRMDPAPREELFQHSRL